MKDGAKDFLCRIEHRQPRRAEGEGEEADHQQKQKGIIGQKRQMHPRTLDLKIPGGEKGHENTEDKDQYVCRQIVPSADSCVGKKGRYNEEHPKEHPSDTGGQEAAGGLKKHNHFKECIEKYREKQHFQVFPHGFIYGGKQSHKGVFHTPFIGKMQQDSGSYGKKNAGN